MTKVLCIYHGNCADGFAAAWVVRRALGVDKVEFHPGIYQQPPPDVAGRHVVIVDFSYKWPVLEQMVKSAASILILDHHKSAAEDLDGLPYPPDWPDWWRMVSEPHVGCFLAACFDMERSGAGLAWDYFNDCRARPRLIDHIEDRDLWRFKLQWTREIMAAVFSHPQGFATWDVIADLCEQGETRRGLAEQGEAILRKQDKDIAEQVRLSRRAMVIGGHRVPVVNVPKVWASDAGERLCVLAENDDPPAPFAACYHDTAEGREFSLRSRPGGADVQAIAVGYGGGGHKTAAGFKAPIGWEGDDGAEAVQP